MIEKINSAIIDLKNLSKKCVTVKDYEEYYKIQCEIAWYLTLKMIYADNSVQQ